MDSCVGLMKYALYLTLRIVGGIKIEEVLDKVSDATNFAAHAGFEVDGINIHQERSKIAPHTPHPLEEESTNGQSSHPTSAPPHPFKRTAQRTPDLVRRN